MVQCFIGFCQTGAFPASRWFAREVANAVNRLANGQCLVFHAVHRALHIAVPHELPACIERGLCDARVRLANDAVDGQRGHNVARDQGIVKAPKARPHAVLMP